MKQSIRVGLLVSSLIIAGAVAAQGILLDFAADKVIQKYQTSTCEQLYAAKADHNGCTLMFRVALMSPSSSGAEAQ